MAEPAGDAVHLADGADGADERVLRDPEVKVGDWVPDPTAAFSVRVAGATHPGLVRTHNEDAWLVDPPVFVVADGMGGHEAGDLASALVVDAFRDLGGRPHVASADVEGCIRRAKEAVDALADGQRGAPGSTLVLAAYAVQDDTRFWVVANIGDSRAYLWESGALEQVSHDHSVVQELLDDGEIAPADAHEHPERHVITRAIGAREDAVAEYAMVPIRAGSRLLLCSDGLCGDVPDERIAEALALPAPPEDVVRRLVDEAFAVGAPDNVTVVVVDAIGVGTAIDDTLSRIDKVDGDTVRTARR